MTQSPHLRFFGLRDKQPKAEGQHGAPVGSTNGVHGWLMGVRGSRADGNGQAAQPRIIVDADNNCIPVKSPSRLQHGRPESIASIQSEDSVNLDELINANFSLDVDDETDLTDLAALDLDDSKADFWKLDETLDHFRPSSDLASPRHAKLSAPPVSKHIDKDDGSLDDYDPSIEDFMSQENKFDGEELDWSPDDPAETLSSASSVHTALAPGRMTTQPSRLSLGSVSKQHRSDSFSSENSLTSQSTVTNNQYARYGMTPMIYPSESTSTSSRSLSRLSDYSASSQTSSTASAIPRPRISSATSGAAPTPSRSNTLRKDKQMLPRSPTRISSHLTPSQTGRSSLAARASHIPTPPSTMANANKPTPPPTRSTGTPGSRASSRLGQRASHIPRTNHTKTGASDPPRRPTALSRPTSPLNAGGHSRGGTSLFGLRSPTQPATSPRRPATPTSPHGRVASPTPRPSALRPPGGTSRIGLPKKT